MGVGLRGWAAHMWAGVCCAQAPADGALPPRHLFRTQTCTLWRYMGGHCPPWGDDIAQCWPMGAWPLQPGRDPHHSQRRVTATVTPASATVVYGGNQGSASAPWWLWKRRLCCRGKQAKLAKAAGSIHGVWVGGQQLQTHSELELLNSHLSPWDGGYSLAPSPFP